MSTEKLIMVMRAEAEKSRDFLTVALCEKAIEDIVHPDTWNAMKKSDKVEFSQQFFTHELAHAECLRLLIQG